MAPLPDRRGAGGRALSGLTLFSMPKPWRGHIGLIQRNALHSWTRLGCDIVLFGDDEGTAGAAAEAGVRHEPEVARNPHGTPRVDDLFRRAEAAAAGDLLCYINADIILLPGFVEAVGLAARRRRFLLAGRRTNLAVTEPIAFEPGWDERLRADLRARGRPGPPDAIDYFVFRRGLYPDIPPLAIGRTVWDNWLIFAARRAGAAVIDASARIVIVHQDHDYQHHAGGHQGVWMGSEAEGNLALAGGPDHCFTLGDATHRLAGNGVVPALDLAHLRRRFYTLDILRPSWRPALSAVRAPIRALKRLAGPG